MIQRHRFGESCTGFNGDVALGRLLLFDGWGQFRVSGVELNRARTFLWGVVDLLVDPDLFIRGLLVDPIALASAATSQKLFYESCAHRSKRTRKLARGSRVGAEHSGATAEQQTTRTPGLDIGRE